MEWVRLIKARWRITLFALALLSISILLVSEITYRNRSDAYLAVSLATGASVKLDVLYSRLVELETGQRGYLLTHKENYVESHQKTKLEIRKLADELKRYFSSNGDKFINDTYRSALDTIDDKLIEIDMSLDFARTGQIGTAEDLVRTDIGKIRMDKIREQFNAIQEHQHDRIAELVIDWVSASNLSRLALAVVTVLNLTMLGFLVRLMVRDLTNERDKQLILQNQHTLLDNLVEQRTLQLETLANHLQNVSEVEKSRLARELHDELGSILTAAKMDVLWVRKQLVGEQDRHIEKLDRAIKNLDVGIQAKRRIIEDLRPTTLISFGLTTAAQELISQVAERTGWLLDVDLPESDPSLPEDVSIALFRILQEALNNAEKYARAKSLSVHLAVRNEAVFLEIKDDGKGFQPDSMRPKAHGLSGMRQRVHARGGRFEIMATPGKGTHIQVMLPLVSTVENKETIIEKEASDYGQYLLSLPDKAR